MRLIIDVQNVLYALPEYRKILLKDFQNAIDQLIHDLSQYQDWTGHHLTLVFDGPPRNDFPIGAYGIEILYSGAQKTADSVIENFIKQSSSKLDALVVTSDHALQDVILALGARWTTPKLFNKMLEKEISERKLKKYNS